ncbi:glycoside hydrolase family 9 protein [Medicago truncatula]|uniref:cellulase n=1 Tax=Medicago truncatula TaxID=3880 RepID=A0A072U4Y6_MEDTR|nr:glycoside hydrolase family 9 protein [Medicago truncatula]
MKLTAQLQLSLFYPGGGVVDSLSCTILDSATKRLKESNLVVTQPSNNFDKVMRHTLISSNKKVSARESVEKKILKNTILIALKICRDELLWGAAWLHKATKNLMYLNYIKVNGQIHGADVTDNTFGWDNKHAGARILLSKEFLVQKVESLYATRVMQTILYVLLSLETLSSSQYTPGE